MAANRSRDSCNGWPDTRSPALSAITFWHFCWRRRQRQIDVSQYHAHHDGERLRDEAIRRSSHAKRRSIASDRLDRFVRHAAGRRYRNGRGQAAGRIVGKGIERRRCDPSPAGCAKTFGSLQPSSQNLVREQIIGQSFEAATMQSGGGMKLVPFDADHPRRGARHRHV